MSKAILISTRPQWVEKILNGIKKDEIRKGTAIGKAINKLIEEQGVAPTFIYCTKGNKNECLIADLQPDKVYHSLTEKLHRGVYSIVEERAIWNDCKKYILNGKVVARFNATAEEIVTVNRLDTGEVILYRGHKDGLTNRELMEGSCLTFKEMNDYLQGEKGTDIHITKLEIFDTPKELSEFWNNGKKVKGHNGTYQYSKLTRAPQSFMFIEV